MRPLRIASPRPTRVVSVVKRVPGWAWSLALVALAMQLHDSPLRWALAAVVVPLGVYGVVRLARIVWQTPRALVDGLHGR